MVLGWFLFRFSSCLSPVHLSDVYLCLSICQSFFLFVFISFVPVCFSVLSFLTNFLSEFFISLRVIFPPPLFSSSYLSRSSLFHLYPTYLIKLCILFFPSSLVPQPPALFLTPPPPHLSPSALCLFPLTLFTPYHSPPFTSIPVGKRAA